MLTKLPATVAATAKPMKNDNRADRRPSRGRGVLSLKVLVFLLCLVPLGKLVALALNGALGANPIEKITHTTGWWTLAMLMIVLTVTPLRRLTGQSWLMRLRRMLGLFSFFYACLHFLTYLVIDQFFDWPAIVKDVIKRPYITVGFSAFMMLIPLAITSTDSMQRRLGGRNWKRLHRLVYLIALAGVVHFWWLVKKDISEPARFAAILSLLLGYRLVQRRSAKSAG